MKDETPLALQADVVYHFEGSCDKNQTYIGRTKRHLATRVREHLSGNSANFEHISTSTHVIIPQLSIFIYCQMVVMTCKIK